MKNAFFVISFFLFLSNCGGFEFVLKTNDDSSSIKNFTKIYVTGDDASRVYVLMRDLVGNNKDNNPKYSLSASVIKEENAEVITKDATASKFNIKYSISYELYNLNKNCYMFNKQINTVSTYNSKSAGYSFGTDFSEKESNNNNISKNINEFITSLNELKSLDTCNN